MNIVCRLLLLITLLFSTEYSLAQTAPQCDSIKIYSTEFDKVFQQEFAAIQADTVLAIRHCYSTNGCGNTYGILCWKTKGNYNFKKIEKRGQRITYIQNIDQKLRRNLISFFENEVYLTPDIELKRDLYISDGPLTTILYKNPSMCWNFTYRHTSPLSVDKRVLWINNIEEGLIKIDGRAE